MTYENGFQIYLSIIALVYFLIMLVITIDAIFESASIDEIIGNIKVGFVILMAIAVFTAPLIAMMTFIL